MTRIIKPQISMTAVPVNTSHEVDLIQSKFDEQVDNHGINITLRRVVNCPCRKDVTSQAVGSCINCDGTGFYFYDSIETKALITSTMNDRNNNLIWTENLSGTANITVKSSNKLNWMDMVIVRDGESLFSGMDKVSTVENLRARGLLMKNSEGSVIATGKVLKCHYSVKNIHRIFKFIDAKSNLIEMDPAQMDIQICNEKYIVFNDSSIREGDSMSVVYDYCPTYLIMDIVNDYRNSYLRNTGSEILQRHPIKAIMKRSHLVFK